MAIILFWERNLVFLDLFMCHWVCSNKYDQKYLKIFADLFLDFNNIYPVKYTTTLVFLKNSRTVKQTS